MNRRLMLFAMTIIVSATFTNCSEKKVTAPENTKYPTVNIICPVDSASFLEGEVINFTGIGIGCEGSALEDSLLWTSDKDGLIGTGNSVSASLSINEHRITLTFNDSDGKIAIEQITVYVIAGPIGDYDLIVVPATPGYPMGWEGINQREEPVHTVSLDTFQIGKYEVPYELWSDVKTWAETQGYIFDNPGQMGYGSNSTDKHPVTNIDWRDCIVWCNAYSEKEGLTPIYYTTSLKTTLYRNSSTGGDISNDCVNWDADGFRLPTEAEWEYAARYIDGTYVSSGAEHSGFNLYPIIGNCAWYIGNSGYSTHTVGGKDPNNLVIHDMSGNVWEWCWDWYGVYLGLSQDNPAGPDTGDFRVLRGGCWIDNAWHCRTANRSELYPSTIEAQLGFRVCLGGFTQ